MSKYGKAKRSLNNTAGEIILSSIFQSVISGDPRIFSIWNKIKESTKHQLKKKKIQRDLGTYIVYKIKKLLHS